MSKQTSFQKRIGFDGDLKPLLSKVCKDYELGNYESHYIITIGYEDLNVCVRTNTSSYLVKALATFRDSNDRLRYSEILQAVAKSEVAHPKLHKTNRGYLHSITLDGLTVCFFIMQFIEGASFYDLGTKPSKKEIKFLSRQAALINKFALIPKYTYNEWAIENFIKEYGEVKSYLNRHDVSLIEHLVSEFGKLHLASLPHCFVHGDIIDTNVLKDAKDSLWIIDFTASSFSPRIQELAVFSCSLLFDHDNTGEFLNDYQVALDEYMKVNTLTNLEINLLPLFTKVAHAMHIIGATKTKLKGEDSKENQHWLSVGRQGLAFTSEIWVKSRG